MRSSHSEIHRIDGVGVDLERFYPASSEQEKKALRESYGFSPDDFILLYTAEFIPRKNHELLFSILPQLTEKISNLQIVLCGKGPLLEQYKHFTQEKNVPNVLFTGYTAEVADWCRLSDVLIMPSFQEGLPLAMIEAMATGLPVVASNIRGHRDIVRDGEHGFLCNVNQPTDFIRHITLLHKNPSLRQEMGARNAIAARKFSLCEVLPRMQEIYTEMMK